jgi:ATP-dependent DNA helicase
MGGSAKPSEARQTITEMVAELLALEGEHIEVVQNTAAGKRGVISDAELDTLLDRCKEVFEGRGVGWKSGASVVKSGGGGVVGDRAPAATMTTPGNVTVDSGLFQVPKD